jgi:hypothetical protein
MISTHLPAQKVKYKDLYVLLSANDFEQGEPFLRRFIVNDPEHANANMYMGRLYEYKFSQLDVLKETVEFTAYCDSAVFYYRQAYSFIDEKEIKKNDDYYQEYSRRDLRTGKFGVKVTDVKFDLEKRIDDTENLAKNVKSLKSNFDNSISNYSKAESIFSHLVDEYVSIAALMLKSDDTDIDSLKLIGESYHEFTNDFSSYKQDILLIPRAGYRQELATKYVDGLVKVASPDFYADQVNVYDFKSWTDKISKVIIDDIRPLKENLATYDQQLDDLYKQVTVDSMMVENELAGLAEKMLFEQLNNYDSSPLPSLIFNFKVDEITYYSVRNHAISNGTLDSSNVDIQLEVYRDLFEKYKWVEKAYNDLAKVNVVEKADLYSEFVTIRFGDINGLVSYLAEKGEEVNNQKSYFVKKIEELEKIARWGIHENDSIPLFTSDSLNIFRNDSSYVYKTLTIDTLSAGYVITGFKNEDDKLKNFSSIIGFDRLVDTLYVKPLKFKIDTMSVSDATGRSQLYSRNENEIDGLIYVIQVRSEGTPYSTFEITNLLPETGIKWSATFNNPFSIIDLTIDINTDLIVLKMGNVAEDGQSTEVENLVFNFEGKLLLTGN